MRKALVLLLYSRIEIRLKCILNIHALSNAIDNSGIARFNFNNIKEAFKNYFDIDVKKIELFNSFDELRALNNCLKHEEIASDELEQINSCRWHQGEEVKLTKDDLNRLVSESKKFFYNLFGELRIKLAENQ